MASYLHQVGSHATGDSMLKIPDKPYGKLDLMSVDDHIIEPAEVWTARAPERLKDRAPKVVVVDDGTEMWKVGDRMTPNVGLAVMAGREVEEYTARRRTSRT